MKISQTPDAPSSRIGWNRPSQLVEIADDTDAAGVGRPDGKAGAGQTVDGSQLRAEFFVNPAFVALAKQEQIRFAERRQKGKGVARAAGPALVIGDHQVIGINAVSRLGDALKQSAFVECASARTGACLFREWAGFRPWRRPARKARTTRPEPSPSGCMPSSVCGD